MSATTFLAFERLFDRSVTYVLLSLGVILAGATLIAGS